MFEASWLLQFAVSMSMLLLLLLLSSLSLSLLLVLLLLLLFLFLFLFRFDCYQCDHCLTMECHEFMILIASIMTIPLAFDASDDVIIQVEVGHPCCWGPSRQRFVKGNGPGRSQYSKWRKTCKARIDPNESKSMVLYFFADHGGSLWSMRSGLVFEVENPWFFVPSLWETMHFHGACEPVRSQSPSGWTWRWLRRESVGFRFHL